MSVVATLQAPSGRGWRVDAEGAAGGHLIADTVRSHPRPGSNSNGSLVAPALVRRYAKGTDSDATDALIAHTLRAEGFDASEDGTGRGTPLAYAFGSHAGSNGDASNRSHGSGGPVGMGIREGETPALRAGRTQAIAQSAVRRLTPVECERLQAFPDGWTIPEGPSLAREPSFPHRVDESCPPPDGPRYAAMGDAVTVSVLEWIGRRLLAADLALRSTREEAA